MEEELDLSEWVCDLMTLLDLIELTANDPEIQELTKERFDIAIKHGTKVIFGGETSGKIH